MDGAKLKSLRKRAGHTQKELADAMGVHFTSVSRWERYGELPEDRLPELAEALGVEVADLLDDPAATPKPAQAPVEEERKGVRTSGEVNAWRDKLGVTPMNMYLRLILAILPSFRTEEGVVLVTRQQLIDDANLPGELVDEHWPAVLESEWVERVGEVEWAFRLVMPEG